ncbi:hypothetical protein OS493_027418 [Desmophyllum pertusum]|uniref:Uncharacterized protein n=1 Tax=Desmophyllum pertusum TaxID=174260 RepID=A0A9W9YKR3_9CNID|nr:hypothetical protein OS493_027418 [Desmophyllum pertusum]
MRAVSDVGNHKESEDEVNHGVGDEHPLTSNASEVAEENTITGEQAEASIEVESNAPTPSREQHTAPRVRQSFSWLVSSSDAANEQKGKGKRPMERRRKSGNESPSTKMKQKMRCDASSSSSADCDNKNPTNYNSGHERNKKSANQGRPGMGNIGDMSTSRAGFGVLPQESSKNPSASARPTACGSLRETLPTDDKEEERNVQSL